MENNDFLMRLSQYLFWDCNITMLDPNIDKKMILERVFSRGTEKDEKEIFCFYGKEVIKNTVPEIKYFDKKTLNYLSCVLNIPREDFKCYKKSLLESPFGIS
jgi:two-component SAPR family response regulator